MAVVGTSFREFYSAHSIAEKAIRDAWSTEPDHPSTLLAARYRLQARPYFRMIQKNEARWIQQPESRGSLWSQWEKWHAAIRSMAHELGKIPNQRWATEPALIRSADDALKRAGEEWESAAGVGKKGTGPIRWKWPVAAGTAAVAAFVVLPYLVPVLMALRPPPPPPPPPE